MNRESMELNSEKTREHLSFDEGVKRAVGRIQELFKEKKNVCILIRGDRNHVGKSELMKQIRLKITDHETRAYVFNDVNSMRRKLVEYDYPDVEENNNNLLIIEAEFTPGIVLEKEEAIENAKIDNKLVDNTKNMPLSVDGVDLTLFIYDKNSPPKLEEGDTILGDIIIANDKVDYESSKPRAIHG